MYRQSDELRHSRQKPHVSSVRRRAVSFRGPSLPKTPFGSGKWQPAIGFQPLLAQPIQNDRKARVRLQIVTTSGCSFCQTHPEGEASTAVSCGRDPVHFLAAGPNALRFGRARTEKVCSIGNDDLAQALGHRQKNSGRSVMPDRYVCHRGSAS